MDRQISSSNFVYGLNVCNYTSKWPLFSSLPYWRAKRSHLVLWIVQFSISDDTLTLPLPMYVCMYVCMCSLRPWEGRFSKIPFRAEPRPGRARGFPLVRSSITSVRGNSTSRVWKSANRRRRYVYLKTTDQSDCKDSMECMYVCVCVYVAVSRQDSNRYP